MPIFQQCSATEVHHQYGTCNVLYTVYCIMSCGTFTGEYFLAEIIESQDSCHQTIVAEVNGHAVGFMSISSEVDVEFLNDCYQLESFHGLKHPQDSDEVQTVSTEG